MSSHPAALVSLLLSVSSASAQESEHETAQSEANSGSRVAQERQVAGTWSFNFQDAPWPAVLERFAEGAGLTLDMTDTPPGSFNYIDDRPHTVPDALDVLD